MKKELINYWIEIGIAFNAKDGAWAWTDKGKKEIDSFTRMILSNVLYEDTLQRWEIKILQKANFNKNGRKINL